MQFRDAVRGLEAGDFSRLARLFRGRLWGSSCTIIEWFEAGLFAGESKALEEAFACACFLGKARVVERLLAGGVLPSAGWGTGLNGIHWAVNRGQLEVVELLLRHKVPLDTRNSYDTTVLGTAVWSAIHEPRSAHLRIIEALLRAGAPTEEVDYPTGHSRVDELLRQRARAP
jgi:hypothetical protein